jgi:hypothetical protein
MAKEKALALPSKNANVSHYFLVKFLAVTSSILIEIEEMGKTRLRQVLTVN